MTANSSNREKKRNVASDSERTRSNLLCKTCGYVFAGFLEQMAEHNAKQMAKSNPKERLNITPMSPVLNAARRTTIATLDPHPRAIVADYPQLDHNTINFRTTNDIETITWNYEPETTPHHFKPEKARIFLHNAAYAQRFMKAFQHAVILCGGKPSTF